MVDTIIVGAGSAGCVLADRLTADGSRDVLLIEAGGAAKQREIAIPVAFSKLFKTEVDWDYTTEPQSGLDDRELYCPRGKVLGGSSSLNAMIYIRGNRRDYDDWAAEGNEGWAFDDLLPLFVRAEDQARGASAYHGVGGPLRVEDPRSPHVLSLAFVEAGRTLGLPVNDDFNGPEQDGVGVYQVTQRRGRRWSAADAFLAPALRRPNLHVRTRALVTRLTFEGTRATGVELVDLDGPGDPEHVPAGEVVVCGGAINSPQLLMLSGLGPADALRALGLDVVADLPGVGENLQDHPAVAIFYECLQPFTLTSAESLRNLLKYLFLRRGALTSNVAEAGGFVRTRDDLDRPDIQFHFAPALFENHGLEPPEGHGFSFGPTLVQPRSRGRLTLSSADPADAPRLQPNLFADPADMEAMVAGLRLGRELAHTAAFEPWRGEELGPGADAQDDAALEAWVREKAEMIYHPVGTCRMGSGERDVVDASLRVHGVDGVRVIDASIMPRIVGGNTNAPTYVIAEKGAELIRTGW